MASKNGLIDRLNEVCDELGIDRQVKNPNIMQHELFVASGDIKYRTGIIHLYHPYIVVLSNSYGWLDGKKHFTYRQTMEDGRFNRELPIAFESIYKFWQRIADYLCVFFPELLLKLKGKTFFQHPFDHINSVYPHLAASENFKWLNEFMANEYPLFNQHRKFFVHYSGYDTDYFNKFLSSKGADEAGVNSLDQERRDWLPYLKRQLELCNDGYIKLMNFLNEIEITHDSDGKIKYDLKSPTVASNTAQ
ncbi:hypothetical protein [Mucilaginibacter koreensis]